GFRCDLTDHAAVFDAPVFWIAVPAGEGFAVEDRNEAGVAGRRRGGSGRDGRGWRRGGGGQLGEERRRKRKRGEKAEGSFHERFSSSRRRWVSQPGDILHTTRG